MSIWAARHGGVTGWQPTTGKGGRPSNDWTPGMPPSGMRIYVQAADGKTAQAEIDTNTSPLGDAAFHATTALGGSMQVNSAALQLLGQMQGLLGQQLQQTQALTAQVANLANVVTVSMERIATAQSLAVPGEIAKGISEGLSTGLKMLAPLFVKPKGGE